MSIRTSHSTQLKEKLYYRIALSATIGLVAALSLAGITYCLFSFNFFSSLSSLSNNLLTLLPVFLVTFAIVFVIAFATASIMGDEFEDKSPKMPSSATNHSQKNITFIKFYRQFLWTGLIGFFTAVLVADITYYLFSFKVIPPLFSLNSLSNNSLVSTFAVFSITFDIVFLVSLATVTICQKILSKRLLGPEEHNKNITTPINTSNPSTKYKFNPKATAEGELDPIEGNSEFTIQTAIFTSNTDNSNPRVTNC